MLLNNTTIYDYDYIIATYDYNNKTTTDDYNKTTPDDNDDHVRGALVYMYVITYSLIILLGLPLHTHVICTIACKMERRTAATAWFLGLSVGDLIVILLLPFRIVSALEDFTWRFQGALCRACSYLAFLNMHSAALLLAFLAVVRSLSGGFCHRRAVPNAAVLASWFAGAVLSIPSLLYRGTEDTIRGTVCREKEAVAIAGLRFLSGWLFPFCVALVCSCLVSMKKKGFKIRNTQDYHVVRLMIAAFLLCWLPYHVLALLSAYRADVPEGLLRVGRPISTVLAFSSSCINPIIYMAVRRSVDMRWMQHAFSTRRGSGSPKAGEEKPDTAL
ncbi:chemerin-like receptor 2 [Anguilla rostrata]|uniref:chemerin-like receptor 2 n=1 Tax=Anguilla rostrata TaxID=7938 RepID=UPI0030CCD3EC